MSACGRIVLHVGVQKTGSTYLQRRLRGDVAGLRAQGVYLPVQPQVAPLLGNAKLLATVLNGAPTHAFRHAFPEIVVEALDPKAVTAELLADWRPEREALLLSAEIFRPWHAPILRSLLPSDADIAVVLFVRRQDLWIESYHRQLVKTADAHGPLTGFIDAVLEHRSDALCHPDWWAHREAWRGAFGACEVVLYDEARQDLFGALFTAGGLLTPSGVPEVPPQQVALDLHQLAYLLALDPSIPLAEHRRRRTASAQASQALGGPEPRSLLSHEDAQRLNAAFAPSNRRLLQALGRSPDDPVLQIAPPAQPPVSLEAVYASDAYARHSRRADDLYAEVAG